MEQSSSFVQHQPFQLHLLRSEFQLDKLPQDEFEKGAGAKRRRKKCGNIEIYSDELLFCSSSATSPVASKSLEILKATGEIRKQDEKKFKIRRSVKFSSATARCMLWRVHGHGHWEICRYERNQGMWNLPNLKLVAYKTATEKPYASSKSDCQGGPKAEKIRWSHNIHVSPATAHIEWTAKGSKRTMRIRFTDSCELRSQILSRSLVFLGAWIRSKQ